MSIQAYVLINVSEKDPRRLVEGLKELESVTSVSVVTGPYDLIAIVEAEDLTTLSHVITQEIHPIKGVERTLSCIVLDA